MVNMKWSQLMSNRCNHSQTNVTNNTEMTNPVYVFTPVAFTVKLVLVFILVNCGIAGLVGNILIHFFISRKKNVVPFLQKNPFVRNLNLYVKSLALSDILSNLTSLPLCCVQVMFDVFEDDWPWTCKLARYVGVVFPSITMDNLMIISIERFLSTRAVPRSFSAYTVRKLVYGAWIVGIIIGLAPAAIMNRIRFDLNDTHYTMVCKHDVSYLPFRVMGVSFTVVQHFIPSVILSCLNIRIAITMWSRKSRTVDIQKENGIKKKLRSETIRGTFLLIAMTFAFIIPYSALLYYAAYAMITKPYFDFETDYITRIVSLILCYSHSVINFIIYLVQMRDFRAFLKELLCKLSARNINPVGQSNQTNAITIPNNTH